MKKILIIEDDISISELERDYLEIDGYEVRICNNGADGESIALSEDFDLIVLDLMLPGKDGFSICRNLRNKLDIPIIMVTARKEDIDKIRGLGIGADDYVTKPFSPGELVARVKSHITRYDRLKGSENNSKYKDISVRGLEIQYEYRKVLLNKKEVILTGKEFELLYLLLSEPNKVFTKEELYEKIWDNSYGDITTVTVHVRKLREKIEYDPSNPQYIDTIWGVGYRFKL